MSQCSRLCGMFKCFHVPNLSVSTAQANQENKNIKVKYLLKK